MVRIARFWILGTAVLGCGRIGFGTEGLGARDGGSDAGADAARSDGGGDAAAADSGPSDTGDAATCTPCDPFEQCGCGAGRACYSDARGTAVCGARGTDADGEPCFDSVECVPRSVCAAIGRMTGVCTPLCRSAADCSFGSCIDASFSFAGACERECDPLSDAGCAASLRCYVFAATAFASGSVQATSCASEGGRAEGEPCRTALDCGPRLTCAMDTCRALCDVDMSACASPAVCAPFTPELRRLGRQLGVCVVP